MSLHQTDGIRWEARPPMLWRVTARSFSYTFGIRRDVWVRKVTESGESKAGQIAGQLRLCAHVRAITAYFKSVSA